MTYLTVCAHDVTGDFEKAILADFNVTIVAGPSAALEC